MLAQALRIYRDRTRTLLPMSLGVAVVAEVARHLPSQLLLVGAVVEIAAAALLAGAAVQVAHAAVRAEADRSWRALARSAARALLPVLALSLAVGLALGLAVVALLSAFVRSILNTSTADLVTNLIIGVLLLILGVALATRWAVVVPVALIERTRVGAAFGRSWALTHGRGWRVLGTLALVYLPLGALTTLTRLLTTGAGATARQLVTVVLTTLTWPLAVLVPPLLYHALLGSAPAIDHSAGGAPDGPAGPHPRPAGSWLTKGTRGRLALWSALAFAWLLLLPNFIVASPQPRHPSVVGALAWAAVLAALLRCTWLTWRRRRASRARGDGGVA
ncbi:MAG TPA: hypothetical protein VFF79_12525 [Conexibacter sp.]|nr:hypothetical protein [Conexibacter sp.]